MSAAVFSFPKPGSPIYREFEEASKDVRLPDVQMPPPANNPDSNYVPAPWAEHMRVRARQEIPIERRIEIARSRSAPFDVLSALSQDTAPAVRLALTQNPDTPQALLVRLRGDKQAEVRRAAVRALAER